MSDVARRRLPSAERTALRSRLTQTRDSLAQVDAQLVAGDTRSRDDKVLIDLVRGALDHLLATHTSDDDA